MRLMRSKPIDVDADTGLLRCIGRLDLTLLAAVGLGSAYGYAYLVAW